jgi:nucleoside-diphosphate-sugar epimerase
MKAIMILVTGGTGLLGSYAIRELQRRHQKVRILARGQSLDTARELGGEVVEGDLNTPASLELAMQGVDGVIHAACTFTDRWVDIAAMKTLLAAWDRGPFVFISSVSVYGYSRWVPTTEDHPLDETSDYGLGKIACEALLVEYAKRHRFDYSILRPPHIWGPDPRTLHHRASSTADLYAKIREGKPVILPGETEDEWSGFGDDWIDARELAWAAIECLERPLGMAANAINGYFTWHDFCAELIRLTHSHSTLEHKPLCEISDEELPSRNFFAQKWRYSGDLLRQKLGFIPRYRWQETLAQAVAMDL